MEERDDRGEGEEEDRRESGESRGWDDMVSTVPVSLRHIRATP